MNFFAKSLCKVNEQEQTHASKVKIFCNTHPSLFFSLKSPGVLWRLYSQISCDAKSGVVLKSITSSVMTQQVSSAISEVPCSKDLAKKSRSIVELSLCVKGELVRHNYFNYFLYWAEQKSYLLVFCSTKIISPQWGNIRVRVRVLQ